jgi:hypothetical protein
MLMTMVLAGVGGGKIDQPAALRLAHPSLGSASSIFICLPK